MGSYQEDLESLIELKKKRKPNKADRAMFASAWAGLVREEGFSENAEKFLYNGIPYCGAVPFRDYMKEKKNPAEALDELYRGNLYGKNCVNTAPLLLHLLGMWLNEEMDDLTIVISLINHIPDAMKNKEGKLYGKVRSTLKKYFIDELHDKVKLPDIGLLLEQGLAQDSLDRFSDVMEEAAGKADSSELWKSDYGKMQLISSWLCPEEIPNDQAGRIDSDRETERQKPTDRKNGQRESDESEKLREEISVLSGQKTQTDSKIAVLNRENSNLRKTIETVNRELTNKSNFIDELSQEKQVLTGRINSLEKEREELQDKLDESMEMVEMLRRDRQKQTDENLRKISSKLKEYYQDYMDAKDLEMSPDLGENLRDQLGEVLEILSSAGIFIR